MNSFHSIHRIGKGLCLGDGTWFHVRFLLSLFRDVAGQCPANLFHFILIGRYDGTVACTYNPFTSFFDNSIRVPTRINGMIFFV